VTSIWAGLQQHDQHHLFDGSGKPGQSWTLEPIGIYFDDIWGRQVLFNPITIADDDSDQGLILLIVRVVSAWKDAVPKLVLAWKLR